MQSIESMTDEYPSEPIENLLYGKSPFPIPTFAGLMDTIEKIQGMDSKKLPPELNRLRAMTPAIRDLDAMIGQAQVKESLLNLILFAAQGLHKKQSGFMNVCIYAPPGTGKTKLTQIIADIFYYSGLLKKTEANTKQRYILGTRSSLVGGYLGQTAIATQKLINQCINEGKCLLIDEVYALGSADQRDSFSKECIDTLNQNLSEHPDTFRLIIAGYRAETERCFFQTNKGLSRRFSFTYDLETYQPHELREMFFQQLAKCGYDIENRWTVATEKWFLKHKKDFCFAGGDIENLSRFARLRSSKRCFCLPIFFKSRISKQDMNLAMQDLISNRVLKPEELNHSVAMMYT